MIELITASAGSGKTYTLAKKYIRILLEAYLREGSGNTMEFEHILAVTFTNKATAEMKDRILQELYILSQNPGLSDYYTEFCKSYGKEAVSDPGTWRNILFTLLHNYSRFCVSTIDTFFQSVLRHFAREIGEFNSYRIELDRYSLVSEAADNLLCGISSAEDPVFKVVSGLTGERMGDGKKFSPKQELTEIAKALMGGEFTRVLESIRGGAVSEELTDEIKNGEPKFSRRVKDLEKVLKADLKNTLALLKDSAGHLADCFEAHKAIVNGQFKLGSTISNYASDPEAGKLSHSAIERLRECDFFKNNAATASAQAEFEALCTEFLRLHTRKIRVAELLKYIPYLKFTVSVFKAFAEVTDSAGVKCLEDTTEILSQIIAGSDAPFIYEKIGTRFDHYLLDEFQDTSHVQWENFKPLLQDAISKGGSNLIVGDVKQSIYRFRNSDYTILDSEVPKEFAGSIRNTILGSNFRSGRNIVAFNNDLFAALAGKVDATMDRRSGSVLQDIYLLRGKDGLYENPHTVGQMPRKDFDGFVHYESFVCEDADDAAGRIYPEVVGIVQDLCGRGVRKSDILILVKGREQGSHIAEDLLREGIGVYSDDSLFVSSNAVARRLLSVLRYMDNPKDLISRAIVDSLGEGFLEEDGSIGHSTLVELCEKVIAKLKEVYCATPEGGNEFEGSVPYLSSLVDIASSYETDYGNSLHAFLDYFGRKEAKIASCASDEAVRVMTIHKSKGLAGEFVIVPFANKAVLFDSSHNHKWSVCNENAPLPDGSHDLAYFASLSKTNADSAFSEAYAEEYKQRCIDAMNLLYVAFTRAQHGLYVLEGETGSSHTDNLAGLATEYLAGKADGHVESSCDGSMVYELGDLDSTVKDYQTPKEESNMEKRELLDRLRHQERMSADYAVYESRAAVRNSVKANEFFDGLKPDGDECVSDSRLRGVLQHSILSAVRTVDDVDAAVEDKWQEGILEGSKQDAKAYLKAKIDAVAKYGWYDPEASIITEASMLVKTRKLQTGGDGSEETPIASRVTSGGEVEYIVSRRPDRIVVHPGGSVDIVDYKFTAAADANLQKYRRQVAAYCNWYRALPECAGKTVKGYVWYVNFNTVRPVGE